MKKKNAYYVIIFGTILIGLASWAFYNLLYSGADDLFSMIGISSEYARNGAIIVLVMGLLWLLGWRAKKIVDKLIN